MHSWQGSLQLMWQPYRLRAFGLTIPVLGSPTPPNGIPPTPKNSPSRICVTAHTFALEGRKTVICHEDRFPKTPDPCDSTFFPARFTRKAAKAVNCHEDRIPNMPDLVTVDTSQRKTTPT